MEPSSTWYWSGGSARGSATSMVEQAKEELQILEAQHPNRFDYLKLELKSFISFLESQNNNFVDGVSPPCIPTSSPATSQGSSTTKKRKKGGCDVGGVKQVEASKNKVRRVECDDHVRKKGRIDVVIERAQACLRKIRLFKTSFS